MPTPLRAVRVSDAVWKAAQERAAVEGRSVSAVVVEALSKYGRKRVTSASPLVLVGPGDEPQQPDVQQGAGAGDHDDGGHDASKQSRQRS